MKKIFLLVLLAPLYSFAIDNIPAFCKAVALAKPGDTVILDNGTYRNEEIVLSGNGSAGKPVIIRAQTAGGVIITGNSVLRLAGTWLELSGFKFSGGVAPKGSVIEFRAGKEVANHCRITNCVVENYNPPNRITEYSWVLLYGKNNRFDHNSISGKLNNGVTLAVILDEERNQQNNHLIEYNYFGSRPNLGSNGGETIRVGTSQSSLSSSNTIIQYNFFEHCDGEVEIVSIKSCDNIIRNNTFYESCGVLALRHGHRNIVTGNTFFGNRKAGTGGIRVINEGHTISNNYFNGLTGNRFFAALAVMNAVPNSLPNRYHQVKDVTITNNLWVDCDHIQLCVGKDNERTLPPANVLIEGNTFYNKRSDTVFEALDDIGGFTFVKNSVGTRSGNFARKGFSEIKNAPAVPPVAVKRSACGAAYYKPVLSPAPVLSGKVIRIEPGQNTLLKAIEQSAHGDIIELTAQGDYMLDAPATISHYIQIRAAITLKSKPVIRYNGSKGTSAVFIIADGGRPELLSLAFNNQPLPGLASAGAALAPAASMSGTYDAFVYDCEFFNYTESSNSAFRAQKNTYADTLFFSGCLFHDMSGDAIYLSAEKEDAGKYSAEYVAVKNCEFHQVLGYAVDLYRGGSDESTTGPNILIDGCKLNDVNNKERGAGIRLLGVQVVAIKNTVFDNTGRGGASIRFDESSWDKVEVSHCTFNNSGKIISNYNITNK